MKLEKRILALWLQYPDTEITVKGETDTRIIIEVVIKK